MSDKKRYVRLIGPRTVTVQDVEIKLNEWHCLEAVSPPRVSGSSTKILLRDSFGREFEALHRDICAWGTIFALTTDFGPLGIHETVDLIDPTTSNGETVEVIAGGSTLRVPVRFLVPAERHLHKDPVAV